MVSPDDMVARYGADATRMYTLFAAPPDRDLDWQDDGVEGVSRFLARVYRLIAQNPIPVVLHPSRRQGGRAKLPRPPRTASLIYQPRREPSRASCTRPSSASPTNSVGAGTSILPSPRSWNS